MNGFFKNKEEIAQYMESLKPGDVVYIYSTSGFSRSVSYIKGKVFRTTDKQVKIQYTTHREYFVTYWKKNGLVVGGDRFSSDILEPVEGKLLYQNYIVGLKLNRMLKNMSEHIPEDFETRMLWISTISPLMSEKVL